MDTQINYSRVNSYLGAWLKHHPIEHLLLHPDRSSPWFSWSCSSTPSFLHVLEIWWTVCSTPRWLCRDTAVRNGVFSVTPCVPCSLLDNNSWWHPSNVVGQEDQCRCRQITSTHFPTIYWDWGICRILFVQCLPNQHMQVSSSYVKVEIYVCRYQLPQRTVIQPPCGLHGRHPPHLARQIGTESFQPAVCSG